ncbi:MULTISPECIES: hypothetical protein [Paraburkholderia]|jgi:hypothetical protein|uniref:hypothetical protein n=1 Tax=Paraburkholderia TaxID=1822464 RepID=UPI0038B93261
MDNRIRGFGALSAIVVLMVFLQHRLLASSDKGGHLGIWILFALTGFLITCILTAQRRLIETGVSDFSPNSNAFCLGRRQDLDENVRQPDSRRFCMGLDISSALRRPEPKTQVGDYSGCTAQP